jgi:hypothetical protein
LPCRQSPPAEAGADQGRLRFLGVHSTGERG